MLDKFAWARSVSLEMLLQVRLLYVRPVLGSYHRLDWPYQTSPETILCAHLVSLDTLCLPHPIFLTRPGGISSSPTFFFVNRRFFENACCSMIKKHFREDINHSTAGLALFVLALVICLGHDSFRGSFWWFAFWNLSFVVWVGLCWHGFPRHYPMLGPQRH